MRILVCGSRFWKNYGIIYNVLKKYQEKNPIVIDGTARGADSLGHKAALALFLRCRRFPANWDKYHRAAGPIRNQQMLDEGKPDLVLAFHDDLKNSKGTKDMIVRAKKARIKVHHISGSKSLTFLVSR